MYHSTHNSYTHSYIVVHHLHTHAHTHTDRQTHAHARTHTPDSVQVGDHNGNLPPQLALIKLVLDQLKGEALMEDTVDASTTTQLSGVNDRGATLNPPLKLITKALNHTVGGQGGEGTDG